MSLERDLAAGIDPVGWLALADLCEERGALADADLWRRRAACLRAVLDLRGIAELEPSSTTYRFAVCEGWAVSAYLTTREVRASLMRDPRPTHGLGVIGRYHLPRASLLGRTQRSPRLAAQYLKRKACEWAKKIDLCVERGQACPAPARD